MKNKSIKRLNSFAMAIIMFAIEILSSSRFVCAQIDENVSDPDDRYIVSTELISSWNTGYNLKVVISNCSSEIIHNWGFVFDTKDIIQGYYSAIELSKKEKTHLVRNAGYNQDIRPGQQIEFGYTAYYAETMDIPQSFSLATTDETVNSDEYEVRLFSVNEWGNEGQASLTIKNRSDKMIEDWKLEFDTGLQIENIWGASIATKEENHYIFLNSEYDQNIAPGETVYVGIIYRGSFFGIDNVSLSQVVIRESAVNGAVDSNENEGVSENTTDENNSTDNPNSSDENNGDGNNTDDNTETEKDIDMEADTDTDGVPDYYEDLIGTDKNKSDTDGDKISDYEELTKTGSDPVVYDSVMQGISDADADSDGDGISNKDELELGMNPSSNDSDMDGIKDGEEAAYGTDPLNEDTDGDSIKDGDELILGFDPLNMVTDGIADNEHKTEQRLEESSEVLAVFNRKNEEYKISVDITAAGLASSELKIMESPYSGTVYNDAIVGLVPHIEYGKSDTIDSITVRFRLDELLKNGSTSDNMSELWDICDKYGIFCYFEEESLFLPIETLYDEDTNSFYTTTDRVGTYCLVDMEKMVKDNEWLYKYGDPVNINIQFILQTAGADKNAYISERDMITQIFDKLIDRYGEGYVNVSVIRLMFSGNPWYVHRGDDDDDIWFTDPEELKNILDTIPYSSATSPAYAGNTFKTVYYGLEEMIKPQFVFLLQNGPFYSNLWDYKQVDLCRKGVYYSEVLLDEYVYSDEKYKMDVEDAVASVGGFMTILGADTADMLYDYVCDNTTDAQGKTIYQTITANGWEIVNLTSPLRSGSLTDTDGDGITDWDEVEADKIAFSLDGEVVLPTIKQCMQMVDKPYVEAGIEKMKVYMDKMPIDKVHMLPIKSSPTRVDTDGDNIPDGFVEGMTGCYQFSDPNPLKSDVTITELDGGYISIDYEKPAAAQMAWGDAHGECASYGGCQMWCGNQYGDDYGGAEVYCSNSVSGNTMHSYGCGVIAAVDSLLYQSIVKANKNHTDIYLGTEKIKIYSLTHIDYDEYMRYVLLASQYFTMYENEMIKGVPGAYLKGNLTGGMNSLADELGLCITCSWECQEHIWYFIQSIKRMISKGYPIPISYYSKEGDERYELTVNYEYNVLKNTINDHYNSITGIIEYSADVEKNVGHKVVLEISNWGRKEYIDCYSYFSARSLFQTTMIID